MHEPATRSRSRARFAPALLLTLFAALLATADLWTSSSHAGSRTTTRSTTTGKGFSYGYTRGSSDGDGRDFDYALMELGSNTTCSVSNNDRWKAIGRLQDEVESTGRELLWFSLDDRDYVVRERELVAKAHQILQPVSRLGEQQGKLGEQQGRLGKQQGEIGRIQGRIGRIQGRLARLTVSDLDSQERAERHALERQLRELSEQVRGLANSQRDLGAQQAELGRRQAELGREQARVSKRAMVELRALAEDSIKNGKAERSQ